MQKADATESGRTTTGLMAHCGGEPTGTTARSTDSGSGTTPMAHCSGESTITTGSERVLRLGVTLMEGALGSNIIYL